MTSPTNTQARNRLPLTLTLTLTHQHTGMQPPTPNSNPNPPTPRYANTWGYCGDEFTETDHFPPQLYVREARRLVGDTVFTQNSAMDKAPLGNVSIGMGCYNFDSHCEERYACDPATDDRCKQHGALGVRTRVCSSPVLSELRCSWG
jgi:hypothetical protein